MHRNLIVVVSAGLLALTACESSNGGINKTTGGTLVGAGLGGRAGAQVGGGRGPLAAVAVGTLLGAFIGHEVGKSLDRADQLAAEQATHRAHAAPINQRIDWSNPESGHRGSVTPVREGYARDTGLYCREYQTTVTIGGKTESAYGTACRQPDGSWKIQE